MVAAERADARCPGGLHAVAARDGLLVRVRVPGGLLGARALAALARAAAEYGDGHLEITARASVQLRGVRAGTLAALGDALAAAGLLPSPAHDRVRNVVASPFAGVDPDELVDARPIVRALDAALVAEPALAALPAKFAFAVDGGGRPFPASRPDIALRAVATVAGPRLTVTLGGTATDRLVAPGGAAAVAVAVAQAALAAASALGALQTWRLASAAPSVRDAARRALTAHPLVAVAAPTSSPDAPQSGIVDASSHPCSVASSDSPSIALAGNDGEHSQQAGVPLGLLGARDPKWCSVVPSVPLGRLRASQAQAVAALALTVGADLRLAWWRGIVLAGVPAAAGGDVANALARLGLPCDRRDGFVGLAACAGSAGCDAALADVRRDAATLARAFAGRDVGPFTANLAGCSKRCAMRRGGSVDLVATSDGYDVLRANRLVLQGVSATTALAVARRTAHAVPPSSKAPVR